MHNPIFKYGFKALNKLTIKLLNHNNLLGIVTGKLIQFLTRDKYRIVKMDCFDNLPNRHIIKKEYYGYVYHPANINEPSKKIKKKYSSLGYSFFKNSMVDSNSPFILKDNTIYKQRYNTSQDDHKVSYRTNLVLETTKGYAYINNSKPVVNIDKGIFFGGSWPKNWYHWIIEILPKIEIYQSLPQEFKAFPLLLPEEIKNLENHIAIFQYLFPTGNIIYLSHLNWHHVKELIWLDSPVIAEPQFKKNDTRNKITDANFDSELMHQYKARVLESFTIPKKSNKRIFFVRTQLKRKYNQNEVLNVLNKYGFTAIYLESLSIIEQVNIINNAEFIVGPTGAAWANLIFSNTNTKALIWMPELLKNFNIYANLAQLSNIELIHYYFPSNAKSWFEFMHQEEEIIIDINEIEKIILKMLSNNS